MCKPISCINLFLKNQKNNPIYNSLKNIGIKLAKEAKKPLQQKLYNLEEKKSKKTSEGRKISHVHGLAELI
jgi:hypothetical protein